MAGDGGAHPESGAGYGRGARADPAARDQPLTGVWRNGQRRSIEAALGDTRWARTRRERLRWVRRFFTVGVWWK